MFRNKNSNLSIFYFQKCQPFCRDFFLTYKNLSNVTKIIIFHISGFAKHLLNITLWETFFPRNDCLIYLHQFWWQFVDHDLISDDNLINMFTAARLCGFVVIRKHLFDFIFIEITQRAQNDRFSKAIMKTKINCKMIIVHYISEIKLRQFCRRKSKTPSHF